MRYVLAVPCVLISLAFLGWMGLGTYEGITEWGFKGFIVEVTGDILSTAIFFGFWIGGLAFLVTAIALLAPRKQQPNQE